MGYKYKEKLAIYGETGGGRVGLRGWRRKDEGERWGGEGRLLKKLQGLGRRDVNKKTLVNTVNTSVGFN